MLITVVASAATIAGLAACTPSHHHLAAKASASASALMTNPAVAKDKAAFQKDAQACVTTIGVLHLARHPITNGLALEKCMKAHAASPAKFNACAGRVITANLTSLARKDFTPAETGLANCAALK